MNKVNFKERTIQNIRDCGQSLIDNAEKIYGDYKHLTHLEIVCKDVADWMPSIEFRSGFLPEDAVKRNAERNAMTN